MTNPSPDSTPPSTRRRVLGAVLAACVLLLPAPALAALASRAEIDAQVREALARLKEHSNAGAELASRAAGVLDHNPGP